MNPRVLATVVLQMEEWCDANRTSQPDAVIEAVAFWARSLRREIPLGGTLAAAAERTDRVTRRHEITDLKAGLEELARKNEEMRRQLDAAFPRSRAPRLLAWMLAWPVGRFLLYWLTIVAAIAVALAIAGLGVLLIRFVENLTGSETTGFVTALLLLSLLSSALMFGGWNTTAFRRFGAFLGRLERNP